MEELNAGDPLILVSGNPNKGIEAERLLGFPLTRTTIPLPEIQASSIEEITRHKAHAARTQHAGRLIVEDVSLGFVELGDFPGPYIHWLLDRAGGAGLAAIARGLRDRTALARCCIGYWNRRDVQLFVGEVLGQVLLEPRGHRRFGWDAWFQPVGAEKTFAEMTSREKDAISHRGTAYRKLAAQLSVERLGDSA